MTTIAKKELKTIQYKRSGYVVSVLENWKVELLDEQRTAFIGPKVGDLHMGFYITVVPKNGKTYLDAAQRIKEQQELEPHYELLEEKNISNESNAFMRRACWYHEESDMMLFVRDIFTEYKDQVYILSCSIPNTDDLPFLDAATAEMMGSFTFLKE